MRTILTVSLFMFASLAIAQNEPIFVEAESFADKGGWVVDQQFIDIMGSPILLAHGMGKPVADATTEVTFPKAGEYRVFVRTRNWVAPWTTEHAPGKFQLSIDGKKLDTIFGTVSNPWHWQSGGTVTIRGTKAKLALHDLTGFDGRVDAIIFTADRNYTPPEDVKEIDKIRRKSLGLSANPLDAPVAKEGPFDFVVVGGGIAGMCSAISAARLGCKVALIQDRPVLGGNNSSEVRVHLQGRMGYPPYPNLGNLVHELDPLMDGNAQTGEKYDDAKKIAVVSAETNLTLYLNTRMIAVETTKSADGSITINSLVGKNIETGAETKFIGKTFADCTGDANLGFLAGAEWRQGRESKAETGEKTAPDVADTMTMGASVQWYSVPAMGAGGKPVRTEFPDVPWAHQFTAESAHPMLTGDWDWETGMNLDQVGDFERIRDNGLRAAYGHWAYMKNHSAPEWQEKADTRELGWVAYIAGKRESRRLMGDIVLKEQDILQREIWTDASVVTTWTIDLHYPEAKNSRFFPGDEFRSVAVFIPIQPYAIPYRCFYSKNVSNLFMAGRCISVTHVALGTIRVMRTGGMMGEVVGMAASLCKEHDTTPRGVYQNHLGELKALMEKGVAPKPENFWHTAQPRIAATAPDWLPKARKNLALNAKIAVSSTRAQGGYDAKYINDGKFNFDENAGRWVSATTPDDEPVEHWVELNFDAPVSVNAVRILSGQAGPMTPITAFVLQRREGDRWIDIPETKTEKNMSADIGKRFNTLVTSPSFRLLITETPGNLARIWELELYRVE